MSMPPPTEMDAARPATYGEEELQLQLALAISREEAEVEERKKKKDGNGEEEGGDGRRGSRGNESEGRSQQRQQQQQRQRQQQQQQEQQQQQPASASLLDLEPWGDPAPSTNIINSPGINRAAKSWGNNGAGSPFGGTGAGGTTAAAAAAASAANNDPWQQMSPLDAPKPPPASYAAAAATLPPTSAAPTSDDAWTALKNGNDAASVKAQNGAAATEKANAFNMDGFGLELDDDPFIVKTTSSGSNVGGGGVMTSPLTTPLTASAAPLGPETTLMEDASTGVGGTASSSIGAKSRSPEDFLGVNSSLVNLDSLVSLKKSTPNENGASSGGGGGGGGGGGANPFALTPSGVGIKTSPTPQNPFVANIPKGPPLNQLKNAGPNTFNVNNNNDGAGFGIGVGGVNSANNNFGGGGGGGFPVTASSSTPLMPMNNAAFPSMGNNANFGFPASMQQQQQHQPLSMVQQQQVSRQQPPQGDVNPFLL